MPWFPVPSSYTLDAFFTDALITIWIVTAFRYTLSDMRNSKTMFAYKFLYGCCVVLLLFTVAFAGVSVIVFFKGRYTEAIVSATLAVGSATLFLLFFYSLRLLANWSASASIA
jgi:hypothetical protein